jgi:hypothetical protein
MNLKKTLHLAWIPGQWGRIILKVCVRSLFATIQLSLTHDVTFDYGTLTWQDVELPELDPDVKRMLPDDFWGMIISLVCSLYAHLLICILALGVLAKNLFLDLDLLLSSNVQ